MYKDHFLVNKIVKLNLMFFISICYAFVYAFLFGYGFGETDIIQLLYSMLAWFMLYGAFFIGMSQGIGILSVFNMLISFGQDRKTVYWMWLKNQISYILGIVGVITGLFFLSKELEKRDLILSKNFMIIFRVSGTGENIVLDLLANILLYIGIEVLIVMVIALISLIFVRFGWVYGIAGIVISIAMIVLMYVPNINVQVLTGHYTWHYIIGQLLMAILLAWINYHLSQKMEV